MSVIVTAHAPTDESFLEKYTDITHDEGRSVSVSPEGQLFVFDYAPETLKDSGAASSLAHTVAIYAPGRWVRAVRS
jgi:hypothetical protein